MKIKKKKKSKLIKTLEEGDLLFNLVFAIWLLIQSIVFQGTFKLFLPYKYALLVSYGVISAFLVLLVFRIIDICMVYTKEPLEKRLQREIEEKRKLKQKLL